MTERFKLIPAVHLLAIRKQTQILMLRRANTGYADGQWSVPAGHLDGGESVTTGMVREAREEIGVSILPSGLEVVHTMHRMDMNGIDERVDFFLLATEWIGDPVIAEPDKCDALGWFDAHVLPDDTVPYVRFGIEAAGRCRSFSDFIDLGRGA